MPAPPSRPRIIVIGGGFAGLWTVRGLRRADADILLIDRTNHHTFQPLLYQVATAGLAATEIAAPLRHILRRQPNVTVMLGEVGSIDTRLRTVSVDGVAYPYDYLVVATGVSHAYFGHEDWAPLAPGLKTLEDALGMRARILRAFEHAEAADDPEECVAWLTFVVVGAGPTGVELAGTLAEIARHTLKREFRRIDPSTARVLLVEAGPRVLPAFAESLSAHARRQLERLGVTVHTGRPITRVEPQGVSIGSEPVRARTVLWAAGVAGSPLGHALGAGTDRAGRVPVTADLSLPGHPEVFVAGDLARVERVSGTARGTARRSASSAAPGSGSNATSSAAPDIVPGIATAAKQMGTHVARTILARLKARRVARLDGLPARPFRYKHPGLLATVGRMAAVVDLGRVRLSGPVAWWFWLTAHVFFLIGFRNRLVVLIDWASAYFTYQRNARIIVE